MGDEVLSPLSFVYVPAFTYLCIVSHICNASESNLKENLGIQDTLIYWRSSNLVNSLVLHMQQVFKCGTIWRHYNDEFIRSDLICRKFLNDWHVGTGNLLGVSGEEFFKNYFNIFRYFIITSPWKRAGSFILKNLNPLRTKDALCEVCMKLARW